jgi:hypothetical protein
LVIRVPILSCRVLSLANDPQHGIDRVSGVGKIHGNRNDDDWLERREESAEIDGVLLCGDKPACLAAVLQGL